MADNPISLLQVKAQTRMSLKKLETSIISAAFTRGCA